MLAIFLGSFFVGGLLVSLSAFAGATDGPDLDLDTDIDTDIDADTDADPDHESGWLRAIGAWVPLLSLRFWSFFAAFFGLTGLLLRGTGLTTTLTATGLAVAVGTACGVGVTRLMRALRDSNADSSVRMTDLEGDVGEVLLPITRDTPGKVRVPLDGRSVDLLATTRDTHPLDIGTAVLVVRTGGGVAHVTCAAGRDLAADPADPRRPQQLRTPHLNIQE